MKTTTRAAAACLAAVFAFGVQAQSSLKETVRTHTLLPEPDFEKNASRIPLHLSVAYEQRGALCKVFANFRPMLPATVQGGGPTSLRATCVTRYSRRMVRGAYRGIAS